MLVERRRPPAFSRWVCRHLPTDVAGARGFLGFVGERVRRVVAKLLRGRELAKVAAAGGPVFGDHWGRFCRWAARETA